MGAKLNVAQFAQAENVPGSLDGALKLRDHKRAFEMKALEVLLDVAGAGGHLDACGCMMMTEPVFQTFMASVRALNDFIDGNLSSQRECYDRVLEMRAKLLREKGFRFLSTNIDEERALLRILAMGRVSDKKRAELFAQAYEDLSASTRLSLVDSLNTDGCLMGSQSFLATLLRYLQKQLATYMMTRISP